jgi:membrane protein implicated in regulation of membrane protease activity
MEERPLHNTPSMKRANDTSIYKLIIFGVLIGIVGVYLRFAGDSTTLSIVSWAILLVGTIVACKGVFKILDA